MADGDTSLLNTVPTRKPHTGPTSWKPGQSGNPNGRPPRKWTWADIIEEEVEKLVPGKEDDKLQIKHAIIRRLVTMAVNGDDRAIHEIFDRMDGKAPQGIDITSRGKQVKLDVSGVLKKVYGSTGDSSTDEVPGDS